MYPIMSIMDPFYHADWAAHEIGATMGTPEERVRELGLLIPDYADPPYGERYGAMKGFHRSGRTLTISGMTP